ncbi:L-threonine ammonia-lyase [Jatrophihabitans sp. GAS493]|uniref:threonine ammonia-lyase IlvA n=1 Tax=Jatrophihabitans sp. GAS493 TaxID=1907575 RepID=UPI000BB9BC96|nr:L-threonine ammonia-lyase [Jatrophihabitans sp. GAS493]
MVGVTTETLSAADVEEAALRLADVIESSPLQICERLSRESGWQVYLKREDLQAVRSYKLRGAFNLMSQLNESERAAGVVCASAGNHAQGVAFASKRLGISARVYLPRTTPRQKRDRIRVHGGERVELILVGDTYDDAAAAALADVRATGATLVPPFDDRRTMAGQGTIGAEILAQLPKPPDVVVVPVGGGGLIAGLLAYLAERAPRVRVVGVEPAGAASMTAALAAGAPMTLHEMDPFVDGAAVRRVGDLPYEIVAAAAAADDAGDRESFRMVEVDEGAICTEMLALYQNEGIIAEPAGALAAAAVGLIGELRLELPEDAVVVALVSGGNNDVSRYGEVVERSLVHSGLKHYFLVEFAQKPGALRQFLDEVLGPEDDITLFEYVKRNNRDTGPALVGIEIGAVEALPGLLQRMEESPMRIEQIDPGSPAYAYLT